MGMGVSYGLNSSVDDYFSKFKLGGNIVCGEWTHNNITVTW